MITFILNLIFWSGLFLCGWQIVRFVFKFNQIELLIPLSLAVGYGVYIFFLNIFSYLIPIRINFYLIFVFLLIIAFILFFLNKEKIPLKCELSKKEGLIICFTVLAVMLLSGFMVSRNIDADDLSHTRLSLAASIAGGNFPVKNLNLPGYDLAIHYGPYLFYAAISKITGFSVLSSFRLSVFLFCGVILLLLFNIAKLFIQSNLKSFLVALVGMFGGGFRFIYGFGGVITLYKKFILYYNIDHPFSFFGDIWGKNPLTGPLVGKMFGTWAALGWTLVLVIIYLYLRNINKKEHSYYGDFLMIFLLSILALNIETVFLILCFGILVGPFVFYLKDKNRERFKSLLKHSILILTITGILVLFQGGTITVILKNLIQNKLSYGIGLGFSVFKHPLSFDSGVKTIPFYSLTFILSFGLIYFLIIPAIIFIMKRHFEKGIFLIITSCLAFLIPLIVSFSWLWQGTMDRFFFFTSMLWATLVGLFLIEILSKLENRDFLKRVIICVCLLIVCLDGILFLTTRPFYKREEYRLDNNSFFAKLRPPTRVESDGYNWVKKNSNIKDYFLVFADEKDIDNQASVMENFRFVMFAQRLAPVYTQSNNYIDQTLPPDEYYTPVYKRLVSDCNRDDTELLNYKYLFVDNNWPIGLEEKCLANNNLELRFETEKEDKFVRIYKINYH